MNKQEIELNIELLKGNVDGFKKLLAEQPHHPMGGSIEHQIDALEMAISALTQQLNNGWIPVLERLPEEKISPVTNDYYEYECTFSTDTVKEVRFYKFGGGHWWHGGGCMDVYVTAWRERPEPYKEVSE